MDGFDRPARRVRGTCRYMEGKEKMSLRVWLPLTKDLRNQGLDDVTVTNNGATFNSAGKLGGCYSFSGNAIYGELFNTNEMTSMSGCCWVYLTNLNSAQYFFHLGGISSYPSKIALDYEGSIRSQVNGVEYNSGITLAINTWYHIAVTVGENKVKWYLNGEEKASTSISGTFNASNHLAIGARINSSTGNTFAYPITNGGRLNDVRIYDHCLSPMEVKQLSQGLVLHYPLNRGGWGQENLLKDSHTKLDNKGYYVGTYAFADPSKLETGKTYTLSFNGELQDDSQTGWYFNIFPSPYTAVINKTTDKEGRFAFSFTMPENSGSRTAIGCYSVPIGNRLGCAIWNVKLEEGEIATPWSPAPSDALATTMGLNGTTEYDTSGYCNNLNKNGTYSYTSDTPKYAVSTTFNGTEWMNGTTPGAEIKTLACWAKTSKNKSTSQFMVADSTSNMCISFYSGCIIGVFGSTRSTGSKCTLSTSYKENDWNHFVVVKTGDAGERAIYCNGELLTPTTNDYWSVAAGFFIGSRNNSGTLPFHGQICDVRAYATALSADDVLSLYQNCATIDPDGTIRGQIRS